MVEHEKIPPLPNSNVPSGFIWPVVTGRELLREIEIANIISRSDLVGKQGRLEGSGTTDLLLYQAGSWCLKTSARRFFGDLDEGRLRLIDLARRKSRLGPLLPEKTVLCLQNDPAGGGWLWTITPWFQTLRGQMALAEAQDQPLLLAEALEIFARAVVRSLLLTARQEVVLDVHPSNFALGWDQVTYWYLDDDIGSGSKIPTIGYAILKRVEEYQRFPAAVETYVDALEQSLLLRLTQEDIEKLDFRASLEQVILRKPEVHQVQQRLLRILRKCRPRMEAPVNS
ncbi:MAG: hypothetical protein K1Y36_16120 [Blastocatellia bacterium]|nr:hypothetical protein [Blastocatellia bacterium]